MIGVEPIRPRDVLAIPALRAARLVSADEQNGRAVWVNGEQDAHRLADPQLLHIVKPRSADGPHEGPTVLVLRPIEPPLRGDDLEASVPIEPRHPTIKRAGGDARPPGRLDCGGDGHIDKSAPEASPLPAVCANSVPVTEPPEPADPVGSRAPGASGSSWLPGSRGQRIQLAALGGKYSRFVLPTDLKSAPRPHGPVSR